MASFASFGRTEPKSTYVAWDFALNVPRNAYNVKIFRQPAARAASFSQPLVPGVFLIIFKSDRSR